MSLSFAVMVFWSDGAVLQPDARGGLGWPENLKTFLSRGHRPLHAWRYWKPVCWLSLGNAVGMETMWRS